VRTVALAFAFVLAASPAAACDLVDLPVIASRSVGDVLGRVESVRLEGLAVRDFRLVRRWTATVRPVQTLRGAPLTATFVYRFDDEQPVCGYKDLQVRRGSHAVFLFEPAAAAPYWALSQSDYSLARP
jgi:hypothetical protein